MSNQYYDNDDLELDVGEITYTVKVHATGTYTYEKETRWDPASSDFEIEDVDATWYDKNDNVVEETSEMETALIDYLISKADWEDVIVEPDYDYYEEREMARCMNNLVRGVSF